MRFFSLRLAGFLIGGSLAWAATNLDREMVLTPHVGHETADTDIIHWQERAARTDADSPAFERLAWAYVAKARLTLDGGFYKLAEKTADVMDAQFGVSAEAMLIRGHVLHNLHRFHAAEDVARDLAARRGSPADLALLSDALIEQGKLSEGVTVLQRLVNLKPGVEAYSRIAHVRWLKGDLPGAVTIMETAVRSASAREAETRAWLLTRLAGYQLQRGEAELALKLANSAADCVPDFAPALLARGRVLLALGRAVDAVVALQQAEKLQPLPEYQWWLADALTVTGRPADAADVERRLRSRGAETDPRTLALFLATRSEEPARATRLARAELKERSDVHSHDALAWALASAGDHDAAAVEMRAALTEGTKDARLLLHAGDLARARGQTAEAQAFYAGARDANGSLTPSERALLARRTSPGGEVAAR